MSEPLFHTSCPSCGGPVNIHSATAVTVVCTYCKSLLVRQDSGLADSGRDSALLTDFSPIQIGTTGRFAAQGFAVIGRMQVRYDAGVWNEWYLRFDDGASGWLSEAGDLYALTRQSSAENGSIPPFDQVHAGFTEWTHDNCRYTASDVRETTLEGAAAEGELPFNLPALRYSRAADWRSEDRFLTIDYTDEAQPEVFAGKTVRPAELALGNIRSPEEIRQSAGSLKGERKSENCPNCGSTLAWPAGAVQHLVCPGCGSDISVAEGKAELIAANSRRQAQEAALILPLGATGSLNGRSYTVIGAVRKDELDPDDTLRYLKGATAFGAVPQGSWTEYLLYGPQAGFLWLVHSSDGGWDQSETLAVWPRTDLNGRPQNADYLYSYGGRVSYAAGAFYWHVRAGDLNYYTDYRRGRGKICTELSPNEMAWSQSTPIPAAQIYRAFGIQAPTARRSPADDEPVPKSWVYTAIGIFILLNLPAWLMMEGSDYIVSLLISGYAVYFLYNSGNADS